MHQGAFLTFPPKCTEWLYRMAGSAPHENAGMVRGWEGGAPPVLCNSLATGPADGASAKVAQGHIENTAKYTHLDKAAIKRHADWTSDV